MWSFIPKNELYSNFFFCLLVVATDPSYINYKTTVLPVQCSIIFIGIHISLGAAENKLLGKTNVQRVSNNNNENNNTNNNIYYYYSQKSAWYWSKAISNRCICLK